MSYNLLFSKIHFIELSKKMILKLFLLYNHCIFTLKVFYNDLEEP